MSAVVLVLFMTVPSFDADRYPHADLVSGPFPQQRQRADGGAAAAPGGHDAGQTAPTAALAGHGGDRSGPSAAPTPHGGGQATPAGHGGSRPGPTAPPTGHTQDQTAPTGHGAGSGQTQMPSDPFLGFSVRAFTVATGYVATGFLGITLLIGPIDLLLRRRLPVSSYLRRDVGMWTAVFSAVHVIYGLQVHDRLANFVNYFVAPDGSPLTNSFGLGNWTGLAALVIVAGLLGLSSDAALRTLKAKSWKWLQRLNYALFALVVVHAFFYGAVVRTGSPYTLLLLLSVVAVFVGQAVGVWLWRRSPRRRSEPSRSG